MATGFEPKRQRAISNPYAVRRFRPEDREGVLELDRIVWDRDRSSDWFRWKYECNPFVDRTPVFVAERDGEIVGARPFMVFRLRAGEAVVEALQPSDTMVHPDHRRRGLFSRMTSRAIEVYADGDPALFFNYPNDVARPGYEKLGWRSLDRQVTYHRIQNPAGLVSARFDRAVGPLLHRVLDPLARQFRRDVGRFTSPPDAAVTVQSGVPHSTLDSLYDRRVPDRLHALRNESFLRWRLGSPAWSRTTYLATRCESPEAALVARTRTLADGVTVTQVVDVLPTIGDERWPETVTRLLAAAVRDHPNSNLISVSPDRVPPSVLGMLGFHPDDRPPLSWLCSRHKSLAVRPLPLEDSSWTLAGRPLDDPGSWTGTFVERDTA